MKYEHSPVHNDEHHRANKSEKQVRPSDIVLCVLEQRSSGIVGNEPEPGIQSLVSSNRPSKSNEKLIRHSDIKANRNDSFEGEGSAIIVTKWEGFR